MKEGSRFYFLIWLKYLAVYIVSLPPFSGEQRTKTCFPPVAVAASLQASRAHKSDGSCKLLHYLEVATRVIILDHLDSLAAASPITHIRDSETSSEIMSSPPTYQVTDNGVVVVDMASIPGNTSGEKLGSFGGTGNLEMVDVVKLLETSGITCCMVGVGALRYYGAGRVLHVSKDSRASVAHTFSDLLSRCGKCACLQTVCREQCKC